MQCFFRANDHATELLNTRLEAYAYTERALLIY
jgi:hypothetical protein